MRPFAPDLWSGRRTESCDPPPAMNWSRDGMFLYLSIRRADEMFDQSIADEVRLRRATTASQIATNPMLIQAKWRGVKASAAPNQTMPAWLMSPSR